MQRTAIYKEFKKHEQENDKRSMDELCVDSSTDFRLLAQQEFMKDYITKNPNWKNFLLYHLAGSGKTCTAITMAEQYKLMNPGAKVTIILPARLRSNFIDELISPCGMQRYISSEDFTKYTASTTSDAVKIRIRSVFHAKIEAEYNIITFDTIRRTATKYGSLRQWVSELTSNSLIIVDEVHNLISDKYTMKAYKEMVVNDKVPSKPKSVSDLALGEAKEPKVTAIWAMLFQYMNNYADPSCKMIYLTASPIFDNIKQLRELVMLMSPGTNLTKSDTISKAVESLRGRVSYFPGTSPNAFPEKVFLIHDCYLTKPIDRLVNQLQVFEKSFDDLPEAYAIQERQACVSVYSSRQTIMKKAKIKDFDTYAPKIVALVKEISSQIGKHVVYSTFVQKGVEIAELLLRLYGWRRMGEKGARPYMTYAVWDGRLADIDKGSIKQVFNSIGNIDGSKMRVVIGSPSIREGVSFKHVQHLHILDPMWNSSALMQLEARAIRFCSHVDIPASGAGGLERKVVIHYYKMLPMLEGGLVDHTADMWIYDRVIPRKRELVELGEKALQKVAIDYYLFRKLYRAPETLSPVPNVQPGQSSPILLDKNAKMNQKGLDEAPKCGKGVAPVDGKCPDELFKRPNKDGVDCCYKTKAVNASSTCGKGVAPVDGKCPDGLFKRPNKDGVDCCYKTKASKAANAVNTNVVPAPKCGKGVAPVDGKCPDGLFKRPNKDGVDCCYKTKASKAKSAA
jgi:hypothetical protein